MNCLFCNIINESIPSKKLYEDEFIFVFLDINPDSNGHMLVIPKKHITDFNEMDNDTLSHINNVSKDMGKLIKDKLNPDGIKFVVNYGELQVIKHYHLHLIPFYKKKQSIKNIDEIYNILKSE